MRPSFLRLFSALLFSSPLFLTSCATLVSGRNDQVSFASNPDGATVYVAGKAIGKTPMAIPLPRKSGQALTFEKEGYKPATMDLGTKTNMWLFGNVVCCGLLGSTTDALSGAAYKYSPDHYLVTLEPEAAENAVEASTMLTNSQKIREFVVMSYPQLTAEIRSGGGEYLKSLFALLKIPEADQEATTKQLTVLLAEDATIPDFAERMTALERPE